MGALAVFILQMWKLKKSLSALPKASGTLSVKGYIQDLNPDSLTPELMSLIILHITLHIAYNLFKNVVAVSYVQKLVKS